MKNILLLVLALLASQANAGIISADFVTRSETVLLDGMPVRELTALNQGVSAGMEVNEHTADTSPVAWGAGVLGGLVYLDLDPLARRLSLFSQDQWDFDTVTVRISNIQFSGPERIAGLKLVSNSLAEDYDSPDVIAPTWSFTNNSLEISYTTDEYFYLMAGGAAVFDILTEASGPVTDLPEPASLGLLGLGLAGLLATRRRGRA